MRPSQKTKEERLWVLDTINKYFEVIVEEEDEEEKEDVEDDEDDSIGVLILFNNKKKNHDTFLVSIVDNLDIKLKPSCHIRPYSHETFWHAILR